eukprot:765540-Hanusia_phi.AAC.6
MIGPTQSDGPARVTGCRARYVGPRPARPGVRSPSLRLTARRRPITDRIMAWDPACQGRAATRTVGSAESARPVNPRGVARTRTRRTPGTVLVR